MKAIFREAGYPEKITRATIEIYHGMSKKEKKEFEKTINTLFENNKFLYGAIKEAK